MHKANFWDLSYLKDTILWLFTVAFVLVFSLNNVKDTKYLKIIFFDSIKWVVVLEFLINVYSFSFIVELIMFPILLFFTVIQAFSETDEKFVQVKKMVTNILGLISIFFIVYAIYKTVIDYNSILTFKLLKTFLLPIVLTIIFIPFLYILALYSAYETYFIRLECMTNENEKVKKVKKQIRVRANINLNRLRRIINNFNQSVFYDDTEIKGYIREISKK